MSMVSNACLCGEVNQKRTTHWPNRLCNPRIKNHDMCDVRHIPYVTEIHEMADAKMQPIAYIRR